MSRVVAGLARAPMGTARAERALELVGFLQDALGFLARQTVVGLCFKLDKATVGSVHQGKQQVKMNLRVV